MGSFSILMHQLFLTCLLKLAFLLENAITNIYMPIVLNVIRLLSKYKIPNKNDEEKLYIIVRHFT